MYCARGLLLTIVIIEPSYIALLLLQLCRRVYHIAGNMLSMCLNDVLVAVLGTDSEGATPFLESEGLYPILHRREQMRAWAR